MYLFATVRGPLASGASALDEFRGLFESRVYRRRVAPELDTVVQEIMLLARRDEDVRAAFDSMLRTWRAIVEATIARALRDG